LIDSFLHQSVLLDESIRLLAGCKRVLDGTAGAGGHARKLAEAGIEVLALDKDPRAVEVAAASAEGLAVQLMQLDFADAAGHGDVQAFAPDGVLLDLGVSSPQIDDDARGFTFRPGAPLDMRMSGGAGRGALGAGDAAPEGSAADWLNSASQDEIERVFREHADERRARRLAGEIVRRRENRPFVISDDLVGAIRAVLGPQSGTPDFARLFQAVRIEVNGELDRLERALPDLLELLEPGGVMAVIAYHSGEDRIVKHLFREWARRCICPPEQPVCTCRGKPLGTLLTKHAIEATVEEIARNPRARSAHLRGFRKAGGQPVVRPSGAV
jgi:16S rRNA (cytosine1402-N4)-methyltransferase